MKKINIEEKEFTINSTPFYNNAICDRDNCRKNKYKRK